jgi:hypothetical protein
LVTTVLEDMFLSQTSKMKSKKMIETLTGFSPHSHAKQTSPPRPLHFFSSILPVEPSKHFTQSAYHRLVSIYSCNSHRIS